MFGLSETSTILQSTHKGFIQRNFSKNDYVFFSWHVEFCRFTGALMGLGMLALKLSTYHHFLLVGAIVILMMGFNYKYLIKAKEIPKTEKKNHFQNQIALNISWSNRVLLYGAKV
jgi:hypothetical protein